MRAHLNQISVVLPKATLTNEDLARENPTWNPEQIRERAGVETRHIAAEGETAVDLAESACRQLLSQVEGGEESVDALIFCTQTPDYLLPPNACVLHKRLSLPERVFAFDLNMGCSGFVNGLALAQGLIQSQQARNLILITADTITKKIHKADRSVRVVFGDGAAATWISGVEAPAGVIDLECSTAGAFFDRIIIPAGGCRTASSPETAEEVTDSSGNIRTAENFFMDGLSVMAFVNSRVPGQIRGLLERNGFSPSEVKLYVFHQASKIVLDSLERLLDLESSQVFRNLDQVGNTFSASVPIALQEARTKGLLASGDLVVLSAFGVGLAWGSCLLRV